MRELVTPDGMSIALRRMRAEDVPLHDAFIAALDPQDLRFRFGNRIVDVPRSRLHGMTSVDHEHEITIVATTKALSGASAIVGEVRLQQDVDGSRAEFAIAVRSDLQRQGLGRALLEQAIALCRERSLRLLYGLVDRSNTAMIALARRLGFDVDVVPDAETVVVTRKL